MFLTVCSCEEQRPNRVLEKGSSLSVLTAGFYFFMSCFIFTPVSSHHVRDKQVFLLSHCNVCSTGGEWATHRIFREGLAFGIHAHVNLCHAIQRESLTKSPFGVSSSKHSGWPQLGLSLCHLEELVSEFSVKTSWVFKGAHSSQNHSISSRVKCVGTLSSQHVCPFSVALQRLIWRLLYFFCLSKLKNSVVALNWFLIDQNDECQTFTCLSRAELSTFRTTEASLADIVPV